MLLPDEEVDLSFETSGKIVEINFEEGTAVKKGQVLAKVNDRQLQAQLQRLVSQLKLAEDRVFRQDALLKRDAETLWLLLPDTDATDLAAKLQRYVFRSKLVLAARDDLHANGRFAAPAQASGATFAVDGDALELDFGGDGGPRTMRISPSAANADAASAARWRRFDLQHGLPRLRDDQIEAWTPQQLSLERLRAFSVKKGCYPGQEIVARTHFLGQVKRGLAMFEADAPIPAGADVRDGERTLGGIVSTAGNIALAVLPLERDANAALYSDGIALHEQPLLGGLAR